MFILQHLLTQLLAELLEVSICCSRSRIYQLHFQRSRSDTAATAQLQPLMVQLILLVLVCAVPHPSWMV